MSGEKGDHEKFVTGNENYELFCSLNHRLTVRL